MWGAAQRITFATNVGVAGDGVLYRPPDFSPRRQYPLVVYIHGGPDDPSMLEFDFWAQVMAARGWLVLRPNYRGSPNLGLKYQRAILYDPEDGPGKDIIAALNAVRASGIVNDSRLAVSGWSYGGIMTAWMISKYHIWKAAVSGASVNDWIADYGTADDSLSDVDLLHGSPFLGNNARMAPRFGDYLCSRCNDSRVDTFGHWGQSGSVCYIVDVLARAPRQRQRCGFKSLAGSRTLPERPRSHRRRVSLLARLHRSLLPIG